MEETATGRERGEGSRWFDDVTSATWLVVWPGMDPDSLTVSCAAALAFQNAFRDVDGAHGAYMARHAVGAVVVCPDRYVFGSAPAGARIEPLLEEFRAAADTMGLHLVRTVDA